MQYSDDGYLPDAVINYLARLGWSHGDDEIFSRDQLIEWFDLNHITPSAAQFNTESSTGSTPTTSGRRRTRCWPPMSPAGSRSVAVNPSRAGAGGGDRAHKDRIATLVELADAVEPVYLDIRPADELLTQHMNEASKAALADLVGSFAAASGAARRSARRSSR